MGWWSNTLRAVFRAKRGRPSQEQTFPLTRVRRQHTPQQSVASGDAAPEREPEFEPGFLANAGDQLKDRRDGVLDKVRLRLRSILTPSQPVTNPKALAGRRRVLAQLIGAIEDQRLHIVLYGNRGMGKTSLLHVLSQSAREARYLVVYGSCGVGTSFTDLFRTMCRDVPLRYHPSFRSASNEAGRSDSLASLLPEGEISPQQLSDALSPVVGTRVLFIVDEFDRSEAGEFREKVAALIKSLSDRAARVQLIIAGVGTNLSELIEHIPSIQRNIVGLQLPLMEEEEVRHLLRIAQKHVGVSFSDEASNEIVRVARGWPYVATLIAHHAVLAAMRHKRVTVEWADARDAVIQAAEEVSGRLARDTLKEVVLAQDRVGKESLAAAAKAHIAQGGAFAGEDFERGTDRVAFDKLVAEGLLLEAREDRFGKTYNFRDVTVPLHLWLSHQRGLAEYR